VCYSGYGSFIMQSLRSCLRKPWAWALGITAGAWAVVAAAGHFEATLPRQRAEPTDLHNLALWDLGPTVRASSYFADWTAHHHPLFVVDGRGPSDIAEKWASGNRDPAPWLEILWREPHDLERVVIKHAGWLEDSGMTAHRYSLRCLGAAGQEPRIDITDNQEAVATHALSCAKARGIHIDFQRNGDDIVRVFEVEAWGR
jgi:hypothetical protein